MKRLQLILFTLLAFPCTSNNLQAMDDSIAPQVQLEPCNACSKNTSLACGKCSVPYCSRNCQISDRNRHKENCLSLRALIKSNILLNDSSKKNYDYDRFLQVNFDKFPATCQERERFKKEQKVVADYMKKKENEREFLSKGISTGNNPKLSKEARDIALRLTRVLSSSFNLKDLADLNGIFDFLDNADQKNISWANRNLQLLKEARTCANCRNKETKSKCPCKGISYCNKVCQKAHWPEHKKICPLSKSATKSNKN